MFFGHTRDKDVILQHQQLKGGGMELLKKQIFWYIIEIKQVWIRIRVV